MFKVSGIFSGFSVNLLEEAIVFYSKMPGITVKRLKMGGIELHSKGNNPIIVYPKSDHQAATFTILNFPVEDIDQAVDELERRGIKFMHYEGDIATDQKGICRGDTTLGYPDIAWFKDPAGNILSILQEK